MPNTNLVKLGVAVSAALALAIPTAADADDAPGPSPAPAVASPGGLSYGDPTAPTTLADGSTISAPLGELVGSIVRVHGTLAGSRPGDLVRVQRLDRAAGWVDAATATVAPDGSYDASWRAVRAGHTTVRAVAGGGEVAAASSAGASAADGRAITLYRRATVTWYGPGFYGRRTACGRRLTHALLGVANKTLPCGTLVDLYNDGRTITVPVIDRGPFRPGTSFDLTAATAKALGVTATTTIGAVRSAPPAVTAVATNP